MKIDGIKLLQMIKNNQIKEGTLIEVSGGMRSHLPYVISSESERLYWCHCKTNICGVVSLVDILEYEFEIIEETPEKIDKIDNSLLEYKYTLTKVQNDFNGEIIKNQNKINELIDKVNYLLEKSDIDV